MKDSKARRAAKLLAQRINLLEYELQVLKGKQQDNRYDRPIDPLVFVYMDGLNVDEDLTEMISGNDSKKARI